jgi:hypothetical protein
MPMGVLSDLVVATDGDIQRILETEVPSQAFGGVDLKGIDSVKFTTLHSILTGQSFDELLPSYRPIAIGSDEGPWVFKLPSDLVGRLAAMTQEERLPVAEKWAETEEFKLDRWKPADVQPTLDTICLQAESASSSHQSLFLWMGL